jgi:hypothetical protein
MKTAIYIEDGVAQLVITPETSFEKDAVEKFTGKPLEVTVTSGSFYQCQGGWIRRSAPFFSVDMSGDTDDKSLILRVKDEGK